MQYEINGRGSDLLIDNQGVHITPKGTFNKMSPKFIPFEHIISIEVEKPSIMTAGYIFFQTVGSFGTSKFKTAFDMALDSNAVLFDKSGYETALKIQQAFENGEFKGSPQEVHNPADELLKWKECLDAGAITQDEFDAKKKQLLGL